MLREIIKSVLVFIFYGTLYYSFESIWNAIFTKPHNTKINSIMQTENLEEPEHLINTVGFARLIMLPFSAVIGLISYAILFIPIFKHFYFLPIYVLILGILLTLSEIVVGCLIFKVFNVRSWDYRKEPFKITEFSSLKHFGLWNIVSIILLVFNLLWFYLK